jgi:Bacterial tandem repeat domain 1
MKNFICLIIAMIVFTSSLVAQKRYIGVFRGGTDGYVLLGGMTEPKLREEIAKGNTNGLQLVDLEAESATNWSGVWRAKKDNFCGVVTGDDDEVEGIKGGKKLMLSNMEYYGGGIFYGVTICPTVMKKWDYVRAKSNTLFIKQWKILSNQGLRLVDIAAYKVNGVTLYAGLFHEGNQAHYLWFSNGWDAFVKKWDEMSKANFRLIDFEVVGDEYIGVYQPGTDAHYLWNAESWDAFVKKWQELSKSGLRLTDFEVTGHN